MASLFNILLLGSRVVLASIIALAVQLMLLVNKSDFLLVVQQGVRDSTSALFGAFDLPSAYQVGYNFLGGDNILVHTAFVFLAYIAILLVLLPFRRTRRRRY